MLGAALSPVYAQQGVIGLEFSGDPTSGARLEAEAVSGIRLRKVQPGSAAAAAGLRVGDLIVAINGQRVQADSLNSAQPTRRAGATLELVVLRLIGGIASGFSPRLALAYLAGLLCETTPPARESAA